MQGDLQQEVQRFRAECEAHLQRRQQEVCPALTHLVNLMRRDWLSAVSLSRPNA